MADDKSIQLYSVKNHKPKLKSLLFNTLIKLYKKLTPKNKRLIVTPSTNLLPLELEREILLRLPAKDLVRYRCVSKCWNQEITSPYFIESHTRRKSSSTPRGNDSLVILMKSNKLLCLNFRGSYNDNAGGGVYKEVVFRGINTKLYFGMLVFGCCNGLVCFKTTDFDKDRKLILRILVVNPVTGKHLFAPPLLVQKNGPPLHYAVNMVGFGYDSLSDDHKILCTIESRQLGVTGTCEYEYNVYSLKANSWKIIEPQLKVVSKTCHLPMVFSNSSLHCLAYTNDARTKRGIYGFDLQTEEFHEVPQPKYDDDDNDNDLVYGRCRLADLGGCLHLAKYVAPLANRAPMFKLECYMTVWVMKEYGLKHSWTKVIDRVSVKELVQTSGLASVDCNAGYHSHAPHMPSPLAYSEDGLEILIGLGPTLFISGFARCDLHSGELRKFHIRDLGLSSQVTPWMCSLVQLP